MARVYTYRHGARDVPIDPLQKTFVYFEAEMEPLGAGFCAIEFDGHTASRQLQRYGARWFASNWEDSDDLGIGLTPEPLSSFEFDEETQILTTVEFERLWQQAQQEGPG